MKDGIEDFIRNQREEFNTEEPNPDVWKGIEKRIRRRSPGKKIMAFSIRAAAVVIIFLLSYAYHEFRDARQYYDPLSSSNQRDGVLPQVDEAEYYYNEMVNQKMEELKPIFAEIPEVQEEIRRDFSELDSMYVSLKKDLKDNIANDQVLEAMIQNYRLKLEILEDLLTEIHKASNNENSGKEKTHI